VGEVLRTFERGTVWASLYACVPALGDYQHKLVSIAHPALTADLVDPFPLTVVDTQSDEHDQVGDMASFERWLSRVLSSGPVHNSSQTSYDTATAARRRERTGPGKNNPT
jgi:hypothetical protein